MILGPSLYFDGNERNGQQVHQKRDEHRHVCPTDPVFKMRKKYMFGILELWFHNEAALSYICLQFSTVFS